MKSDEKFLNEMWQKVSVMELEEAEKENIRSLNRKLNVNAAITAFTGLVILAVLILNLRYINNVIYPVTIGILIFCFMCESIGNKIVEVKSYGNYHIKAK